MIEQPIKIRLTNILNGYHDTATHQDKGREGPLYHFVCFFLATNMIQLVMLMVVCAKDNWAAEPWPLVRILVGHLNPCVSQAPWEKWKYEKWKVKVARFIIGNNILCHVLSNVAFNAVWMALNSTRLVLKSSGNLLLISQQSMWQQMSAQKVPNKALERATSENQINTFH